MRKLWIGLFAVVLASFAVSADREALVRLFLLIGLARRQ
jgi:hypothetical protein